MININYTNPTTTRRRRNIKKIALLTALVTGGVALYLIKNKGLATDVFEKSKNNLKSSMPNITNIPNEKNEEVIAPIKKNYHFEKGKAYNDNGSLFSGVITEKTKGSNVFEIAYKDGLPQTSTKNGQLFKKWNYGEADEIIPATRIDIEEYDSNQNIVKETTHFIKNRLRRLITADYNKKTIIGLDFSKNGNIKRKTDYFGIFKPNSTFSNEEIDVQVEYNKAGKIIKEIEFHPFDKCDITQDGITITGIYHDHGIDYNKSNSLVDIEIPKQSRIIDTIKNAITGFKK